VLPVKGTERAPTESFHRYGVYGLSVRSSIRLSLPEESLSSVSDIELRTVPAPFFSEVLGGVQLQRTGRCPYEYAHLNDGSSYVHWDGIGEFLVSENGSLVSCAQHLGASTESFQVYLLGQALSFALVKNGFEPIHATCMVIDGEAVAFLGNSGFGKSSLAASFLQAGDRLLTDDLLLVRQGADGLQAYPGPPRIKLMPRMAHRFLGERVGGSAMNRQTRKLVIALDGDRVCSAPVPLRAFYALVDPRNAIQKPSVHIKQLSSKEAFVTLLSHTFNYVILDEARLQRQFAETARLTHITPLYELSYPRRVGYLPAVREAILTNLREQTYEVAACGD
jgi:hypothetical protein